MFVFRVGRDVTRVAARAGNQRKPAAAQKPAPAMTGGGWVFLVLFIVAGAWLAELFEDHLHAGRGAAFLMAFGVLVLILAPLVMAAGGNGNRRTHTAMQIRAAHAEQERAKRDRARQARASLPAEMEAADLEAQAWKNAHPQMFS